MWLVAVLVGLGVLASGLFLVYAEEGRGERPLLVPERGQVVPEAQVSLVPVSAQARPRNRGRSTGERSPPSDEQGVRIS